MKKNSMIERKNSGLLIVISGPSGVGKGTISEKLIEKFNSWKSVSMTTRNPREGEIDGEDYYFVSVDEFENRINEDKFIEYAKYNDNYYGTPKDKLIEHMEDGIDSILEIEVQGAKNIKDMFNDAILIYIAPPSFDTLRERLLNRGTESEEEIDKRMNIAKKEIEYLDIYDYVVVNDDLELATREVIEIINSEKLKTSRVLKVNI